MRAERAGETAASCGRGRSVRLARSWPSSEETLLRSRTSRPMRDRAWRRSRRSCATPRLASASAGSTPSSASSPRSATVAPRAVRARRGRRGRTARRLPPRSAAAEEARRALREAESAVEAARRALRRGAGPSWPPSTSSCAPRRPHRAERRSLADVAVRRAGLRDRRRSRARLAAGRRHGGRLRGGGAAARRRGRRRRQRPAAARRHHLDAAAPRPAADAEPPPSPREAGRGRRGARRAAARRRMAGVVARRPPARLQRGGGHALGARATSVTRGELRQAPQAGEQRVLEQRNRRDGSVARLRGRGAGRERASGTAAQARGGRARGGRRREAAEQALRAALREQDEAAEAVRRRGVARWSCVARRPTRARAPSAALSCTRRFAPSASWPSRPSATERHARRADRAARGRRSQASGALAGGRAASRRRSRPRARPWPPPRRARRRAARPTRRWAREGAARAARLRPPGDRAAGARCVQRREALTQRRGRRVQRVRDAAAESSSELDELAGGLGLDAEPAAEPLARRAAPSSGAHRATCPPARAARARQPAGEEEYDEAVQHVEELEAQRGDLESALAELAEADP